MTRLARPEDLSRLRAIQTVSLAEPWPDLLEPAVEGAGIVVVATADPEAGDPDPDEPIGYAVALPEDDRAYVPEIAVAPAHRRAGYGSRLLADLFGRLSTAGVEQVALTVRLGDEAARAFYDAHGFRVRSLVPEHYADGDALRLTRRLDRSG
jgi:ribosomal-protein-alanine N-acetyltransferase